MKRGGPGLTCIPHLTTTQLDPETDIAIVVVSDGVTDAYDPEVIGLTVSDSLVMVSGGGGGLGGWHGIGKA